jgi:hypothetical protein
MMRRCRCAAAEGGPRSARIPLCFFALLLCVCVCVCGMCLRLCAQRQPSSAADVAAEASQASSRRWCGALPAALAALHTHTHVSPSPLTCRARVQRAWSEHRRRSLPPARAPPPALAPQAAAAAAHPALQVRVVAIRTPERHRASGAPQRTASRRVPEHRAASAPRRAPRAQLAAPISARGAARIRGGRAAQWDGDRLERPAERRPVP